MAIENDDNVDWKTIRRLVWGPNVQQNIYLRWLQPFAFSSTEPTALLQTLGGPCAVLAPLQAFLLKQIVRDQIKDLQTLDKKTVQTLLMRGICEILTQCQASGNPLLLARLNKKPDNKEDQIDKSDTIEEFEELLTVSSFENSTSLYDHFEKNYDLDFGRKYDVLSFLYSVILTKGVNLIISEHQDTDEPFIDPVHGHGSQSLVNLLLTGVATSNVFDGVRDLCGLALQGISEQSSVGFLTLLECLRYLAVGYNLKMPKYPVWVLGSETHLTVLFSYSQDLVKPPSERNSATVKFKEFDQDNSGFIPADSLKSLMTSLSLFDEPEYVELIKKKLDSDSMGIILLPLFLEEFFPDSGPRSPDSFTLFHYNGLSGPGHPQPKYSKGNAIILEGVHGTAQNQPVLQILQTKWPNILVDWEDGLPRIN